MYIFESAQKLFALKLRDVIQAADYSATVSERELLLFH